MIFLIDDDTTFLLALKDALETAGREVAAFPDGYHAVKAFQTEHRNVDAILLDLSLPGLSGREVLKELRKIDATTPVIMMTGYVVHEDLEAFTKNEGILLLRKPFGLADVIARLDSLLAR